jgi:SAM-dependent methyltransferase
MPAPASDRKSWASPSPLQEAGSLVRQQGLRSFAKLSFQWVTLPLWRRRARRTTFRYQGEDHHYALDRYRLTWSNERAVEIPLALAQLRARPGRVLEVGDVLGHYVPVTHRVIDKYHPRPGVEPIDVLAVEPDARYDLILSVSTLEHVGWDERPRDPEKAPAAVLRLAGCLAPGGRLWFTVPLGYNPDFDRRLGQGVLGLTEVHCLVRTGELEWREIPWVEPPAFRYGSPYRCANAVAVGILDAAAMGQPPSPEAAPSRVP